MTIRVLVCGADGSQRVETREVPEGYLPVSKAEEAEAPQ